MKLSITKSKFLVVNLVFLIASETNARISEKSFPPEAGSIIEKTYFSEIRSRMQKIKLVSLQEKKADQFWLKSFDLESNSIKPELLALLKKEEVPKIIYCGQDCFVFKESGEDFFKVQFTQKLGEILINGKTLSYNLNFESQNFELNTRYYASSSFWKMVFVKDSLESAAFSVGPLAFFLIDIGAAVVTRGLPLMRLLIGQSLRATAVGSASGAVIGCRAGIEAKYDYETTGKACKEGAETAVEIVAPLMSFTYFNNKVENSLVKLGDKSQLILLKKVGVVGLVASAIDGIDIASKMNGAELECEMPAGSFTMRAIESGATRRTLYELNGEKLEFLDKNKNFISVENNKEHLHKFLKNTEEFKSLSSEHLDPIVERFILEIQSMQQVCKTQKQGYKVSVRFSEGRRIENAIKTNKPAVR